MVRTAPGPVPAASVGKRDAGMTLWLLIWAAAGATKAPPERPTTHLEAVSRYGTAVWHLRRSRLLTAARQLEENLRWEPLALTPRRDLARLYEQLERVPAAIRQLQAVLAVNPRDLAAAEHLARLFLQLELKEEAVETARRILNGDIPAARWDMAVQLARHWAEADESDIGQEQAWRKVLYWTAQHRAEGLAAGCWTPRTADSEAARAWQELALVLLRQRGAEAATEAEQALAQAEQLYRRWNDQEGLHRLLASRAQAAALRGEWTAAVRWQREFLLRIQPDEAEAYSRYARWLRRAGRAPEEALVELQRLQAAGVERPALLAMLAVEAGHLSSQRRTAELLAERLLHKGVSEPVLRLLVREWIEQGRGTTVVRWVERMTASERSMTDPDALQEVAQILRRALLAEPQSTRRWLQQVQATNLSAEAAYFLARLAEELDLWNTAEHFYQQALLRCSPAVEDAIRLNLANALRRQGKWMQVASLCRQRVQNGPAAGRHVFLWYQALALAYAGRPAEAETVAEQAWKATPTAEHTAACLQQSRLWSALGQGDKAIATLEQELVATTSDEHRLALLATRARLLQQLGRREAAIAAWRQVLQSDPDHFVACRELALLLAEGTAEELAQAEHYVRHARCIAAWQRRLLRQEAAVDPLTTALLGRILFRRQQWTQARRLLEQAVASPLGKNDPRIWNWLAESYEQCGETTRAANARQQSRSLPLPIEP